MRKTERILASATAFILSGCLTLPAFASQMAPPDKNAQTAPSSSNPARDATEKGKSKVVEHDGIYEPGGKVLPPKIIHSSDPKYTHLAAQAGIEGDCILLLIVDAEGKPQDIRVEKSLETGLDANAVAALKKFRFKPATLNGKAVPVKIAVNIQFRLR